MWSPAALLAAPAGQLADRFERRRLLAVASLAEAAAALGLAFADTTLAIIALAAVLGTFAAIASPAEFALVPAIVPETGDAARERLDRDRPIRGVHGRAGGWGRGRGRGRGRRAGRARDGIAYLFRDPVLFMTASAAFAKDVLHLSDAGFGAWLTSWPVGMVLGALVVARRLRVDLAAGALVAIVVQGKGLALPTVWIGIGLAFAGFLVGGIAHGTKNVSYGR